MNNFSNVTAYKINSNKSVTFLHIHDKQAEKEIMENDTLYKSHKWYKMSWCDSHKASESSVTKTSKSLKKEIKEDLRR